MEVTADGRSVSREELLARFPESVLNPRLFRESEINMRLWLEAYDRAEEWIVGHEALPRCIKKKVIDMDEDERAERSAYAWLKKQRQELEETGAIMHTMENGDAVSRKDLVEGLPKWNDFARESRRAMDVDESSSYDDEYSSYDDESSSSYEEDEEEDESSSSYEEDESSSSEDDDPPSKRPREEWYACSNFHLLLT